MNGSFQDDDGYNKVRMRVLIALIIIVVIIAIVRFA
jgi:hypothetical protein